MMDKIIISWGEYFETNCIGLRNMFYLRNFQFFHAIQQNVKKNMRTSDSKMSCEKKFWYFCCKTKRKKIARQLIN